MNIGDKKNFLTLVQKTEKKNGHWFGIFKCDCGNEKEVRISAVSSSGTKSCGCHKLDHLNKALEKTITHGLTNHPLYRIWTNIKQLCNPITKRYKGYEICQDWLNFQTFYDWSIVTWEKGYQLIFTTDKKLYSPSTCKYVTSTESKAFFMKINRIGKGITHGLTKHPLYRVWNKLRRDINQVCDDWKHSFENFYSWSINNGWDKTLRLTRKNIDSLYHPDNCYFTNYSEIRKKYEFKAIETNREKYGVDYISQRDDIKLKIKTTCEQKYGGHPLKNKSVMDKLKNTIKEKYGVNNVFQLNHVKLKSIETNIEKYGTHHPPTTKKEQNSIRDWLNGFGFNFYSDRKILEGKEIDIYDDGLKLGIEYCGLLWHSELRRPDPKYHFNKFDMCRKKGIRLITIFSDEWIYRQQQVKNYLMSVLGKITYKVYARECEIRLTSCDLGNQFIYDNHIQELNLDQLVYYGLYFNNQLLSIMSFGRHPRGNPGLVLSRFCCLPGYQIVGGASKLLKQGIIWGKEQGYSKIISWSDNRWSNGKLYESIGFNMEKESRPDYQYILTYNPKIRESKQSHKKSITGCPIDIKESDWEFQRGYTRIWDCGKKRWVMNI